MLRIEHQRAGSREVESGGDSPAFGSQRGNPVCWGKASTGLRLDRAGALPTGVCESRQGVARAAATLHREDDRHETLSGPATRRILEREYQQYGKQEYARLASISVSHIYNLRRHQGYRQRRLNYVK